MDCVKCHLLLEIQLVLQKFIMKWLLIKTLLNSPVEHIDIKSFDARKIIDGMSKMSFTSRDTARAAGIYNEMLADKDCSIFLTLAGSTSAGGCMNLYADLVKNNMIDAIVATGASIIDMDFFEALGFKHYQGSQFQDDAEPVSYTHLTLPTKRIV